MDLTKLESALGVVFKTQSLLETALTHRSYINENPSTVGGHNERLEFLGDAVLELGITEYLFEKFPEKPEGELTSLRAALVNANMLGEVARDLGVNEFLKLSRGEAKDSGRARLYILANAMEAIIGALYMDQGYDSSKEFVIRILSPKIDEILEKKLYKDHKSLFQEEAQERVATTPQYKVLKETGPDHDKQFVVGVYLNDELVAEGGGPSKQEAQQMAAQEALKTKSWG
jgi:ribonuclease III